MIDSAVVHPRIVEDPVSNILKWILLLVAIGSFALFAWATVRTYERAVLQPDRYVTTDGATVMANDDIVAGKAGFQKADLMDYGSLYGMVSYFGQDYTAFALVRLAALTKENLAQARFGSAFDKLSADQQAAVIRRHAAAASGGRSDPAGSHDPRCAGGRYHDIAGRAFQEPSYGRPHDRLDPGLQLERHRGVADGRFPDLLGADHRRPAVPIPAGPGPRIGRISRKSAARRPPTPSCGRGPASASRSSRSAACCSSIITGSAAIDQGPMDPVLGTFRPLTPSQQKIGKYFLVVAVVLLLQILAGTIMAHAYYDRRSFYGLDLHHYLPFNFLRDIHIQAPIIWIGVGWIGAGLFLAPAIAGQREARGQAFLVDLLFWVTLIIVAGALIGNWLGIMGYTGDAWFWAP